MKGGNSVAYCNQRYCTNNQVRGFSGLEIPWKILGVEKYLWVFPTLDKVRNTIKVEIMDVTPFSEAKKRFEKLIMRKTMVASATSSIVHDSKEPLNLTYKFLERILPEAPEELKPRIRCILDECKRGLEFIDELMKAAKTGDFSPERQNILPTLKKALTLRGNSSNLKVSLIPADGEVLALFSKRVTYAAFVKIVDNVIKHSKAKNLDVRVEKEGSKVSVKFTDNGEGFPSDIIYGNCTDYGLGLFLAESVMRVQKGRMQLIDEKKGSTVRFEFQSQ